MADEHEARGARRAPLALAALAGVVAAGALALLLTGRDASPAADEAAIGRAVQTAVSAALEEQRNAPPAAALVYEAILPSLVFIQVERAGAGDPERGLGAGVVVNREGAILTARHVVAGADRIELTYGDGGVSAARVTAEDPTRDIAVLGAASPPEVIVPAVLAGGLRVGAEVFAVGHPLGLARSLSAGVVSGLDRVVPTEEGGELRGLIQFDAAVNPGNSGGPLLNRAGQVVGIVTSLANPSEQGFFVGIGFAAPIAEASGAAGGPAQ